MNNPNLVVISFPVTQDAGSIVERMHATSIDDGKYVLENSPFYAYGISFKDVFYAELRDGTLVFRAVISRGGHSTYRIRLPAGRDHAYFLNNWLELGKLGCTYEGSSANTTRLYAIDVPPGVDVAEVYRLLDEKEHQGVWVFEEGHYFAPSENQLAN